MSHLPARRSNQVLVSRRHVRHEAHEVAAAQIPGKCAAARIQAAAFAAHTGLTLTEVLTAQEVGANKRQGTIMDDRSRAIVDQFTAIVCAELAQLTFER